MYYKIFIAPFGVDKKQISIFNKGLYILQGGSVLEQNERNELYYEKIFDCNTLYITYSRHNCWNNNI